MQGNERIIGLLDELLVLELVAVNQYMAHTKMLENWGYVKLAGKVREQAMDEMRDAEEVIDRILFLEGVPHLTLPGEVQVGRSVPEQLDLMLDTEKAVLAFLTRAVAACEEVGDTASREFFAEHLPEEEKHVDFLETQIELIAKLGEANYLAQQV